MDADLVAGWPHDHHRGAAGTDRRGAGRGRARGQGVRGLGRSAGPLVAGAEDPGGTSAAYLSGVAWTDSLLAATYSDGARFRLAIGATGGLDVVPLPVNVTVRGDHTVTIAAHLDDAVLLTDDGAQGRVWLTRVPGPAS